MAIPKIIHQTYHSLNFPDEIRQSVDLLRENNADWEYRFYDDDDIEQFIKNNYQSEVFDCYKLINPIYGAARADFFRYLLIYKVGGVYLDIKSSASLPLRKIIMPTDRYVLSYWPNLPDDPFPGWGGHSELIPAMLRGEFQNWYIISEPQHAFLHHVIGRVIHNIKNYDRSVVGVGMFGVVRTTGPIAYSQAIMPLLTALPYRLAGSHLDLGLIYNSGGDLSHRKHYDKVHYSELTDPIILPVA